MKRLKNLIRKIRQNEDGALVVTVPFLIIMMLMLTALIFCVAIWSQKRQQLQIMADCASRAGALAVETQVPVLEDNNTYHVYSRLNRADANENALDVLDRFDLKGIEVVDIRFNPEQADGVVFDTPVWSSRDHKYYRKTISTEKQYHNGNFAVYLKARLMGIWDDLLSLSKDPEASAYAQSMSSGTTY